MVTPPRRVFLSAGELFCTAQPAVISTVLGSCIAVCLWSPESRAGGMNHFVLPCSPDREASPRYGEVAIDQLVDYMLDLGCRPDLLQAKIFGGAMILSAGQPAGDSVGAHNALVAVASLKRRGIPVVARRTGGHVGLEIRMETDTATVWVRPLAGNPPALLAS